MAKVVEAEEPAFMKGHPLPQRSGGNAFDANTAPVMEDNPTAFRLKEPETLVKVAEMIDKISVIVGLDAVLKDLVKMR